MQDRSHGDAREEMEKRQGLSEVGKRSAIGMAIGCHSGLARILEGFLGGTIGVLEGSQTNISGRQSGARNISKGYEENS